MRIFTCAVDNGKTVDVVYMDFPKAFDMVPHQILLQEIKVHGVTGNVSAWIEDWLTHRKQRVGVNGCFPGW